MAKQLTTKFRKFLIALAAVPFGATVAAPGTLSTAPLYLSTAVEPNIVILTDDSLSMDSSMVTDVDAGVYSGMYTITSPARTWNYAYSHPAVDNLLEAIYLSFWGASAHALVPPQQSTLDANAAFLTANGYTDWDGVWRTRNSDYNSVYYDPEVTYTPWLGVDDSGTAYADSSPTAARLNPYDSSGTTVDLTATWTYTSYIPHESNSSTLYSFAESYNPAMYYTWTDSDSDGIVDPGDTHTLVEIDPITTTYTGSNNRTDCAAAPTCTYAEEIQNFANWFSYYRSRQATAKNAISSLVANTSSARIGYGVINGSNNIKVASMNADPASGNKKLVMDEVFGTTPNGTTPLRLNLRNVGEYYKCNTSKSFFSITSSQCPILDSSSGGECQQNFTILLTDGYYNGSSPNMSSVSSDDNNDGDDDTTFDGGSYADSYDNTLADVAMHYYESDLDSGLNDKVPTYSGVDDAEHQHMVTYTVAFGVSGTLDPFDTITPSDATDTDPTDAGFSWPDPTAGDPEKIDDLWHAAYNGRGSFLSANNPQALQSALDASLADIVGRTSSSAAVAFNSTSLGTGSEVYLARFNSATWKGELLAHDLDPFSGAVAASPTWNAGTVLDGQSASSRIIYSYNDSTNAGVAFKNLADLTATQQADLNMGSGGVADGLGQERLDYLRGDQTNEGTGYNFRIRASLLGDIVHSNPVYVGQPLMNYPDEDPFGTSSSRYSAFKSTSRDGVIYVGANDGMLHGFDEDTGEEVMAYIPNAVYSSSLSSGLHYFTDPGYTHRYYVDLSPTVADVFSKTTASGTADWATVLVGGLRGGGKGLFALDVTDPSSYTDAAADDVVMWEFTSSDDADMGYSYSKPTIVLTNAEDGSSNKRWAVIVGNGYNNTGDGEAKLFVLFIDGGLDGTWTAGTDYIEITTGVGTAGSPDGLATPAVVDTDGDGIADRVYAGDLSGNLWAFDLTDTDPSNWKIAYKQGSTLKPVFNTGGQPITTKPVVTRHPTVPTAASNEPNIMVFFGTGQYLVSGDKSTTSTQTMYGVWDDGPNGSALPYTSSDLVQQTLDGSSTSTSRVLTDNAADYTSVKGWYFNLPTSGERIVVNPKIRGDYVFYNTLIPDNTACSYGGSGWLMVAKQENGGNPDSSVFDVNNDGSVDSSDLLSGNAVAGKAFTEGLPAESNFLSDNQYTPGSTGNLDQGAVDSGASIQDGRMSWREVLE